MVPFRPLAEKLNVQVNMTLINVPAEKLMLGISIPNETNESISEKLSLVNKYQLKGIALWRIGLINDEKWETLRNYIQTPPK